MNSAIVKAWKDRSVRHNAVEIPDHPAGLIELSDELLPAIWGGVSCVTSAGLECLWNSTHEDGCVCEVDTDRGSVSVRERVGVNRYLHEQMRKSNR